MNASAPALTREGEVQSKIGKVQNFSRLARVVCAAFFGFGLVGILVMLMAGVLGLFFDGPAKIALFSPEKIGEFPVMLVMVGTWLAIVYQLYRLFGNLATGAIYTAENVRLVRRVGLLWLLLAALGVLIPVVWVVLERMGFDVPISTFESSTSELIGSIVSAGLIVLASWIMDVGLYEKDHADALRRDADLVI